MIYAGLALGLFAGGVACAVLGAEQLGGWLMLSAGVAAIAELLGANE